MKKINQSILILILLSIAAIGSTKEAAKEMYILTLNLDGLVHYDGGINNLRATSPSLTGTKKLDIKSVATQEYLQYLKDNLSQIKSQIESIINRPLGKTFDYYYANFGMAVRLTASEVERIKQLEEIIKIEIDKQYELSTDAGPTFIGANTLWDGTAMPNNMPNKGEGVVIGVLDTGINMDHPSFSDVSEDGYDFAAANPLGAGNFVAGSDCSATFVCNNKHIGAWDFADDGVTESDGPEDSNGHGSHTASTAAGNAITAPLGGFTSVNGTILEAPSISGVAPHAHIISYDVCINSCSGAAITAAINQAIADQVDVISYSISGGTFPWNDSDRLYLDAVAAGIMVSAAAGNTNASITNPVGQVNHKGPWLLSVANSSHNRTTKNQVAITQPMPVPTNITDIYGLLGVADNFSGDVNANLLYAGNVQAGNQEACSPFTDNTAFTGKIALIIRGSCNFSVKIDNAEAAGAVAAIIYNGVSDVPIVMGGIETTNIPALMIGLADGDAIVNFINSVVATDVQAFISGTTVYALVNALGNILNTSSFRGPNNTFDVTKPDINGPGTNIFAAFADGTAPAPQYSFLSGTSMSAPHISGSAALMVAAHPTWSPSEIKSAMMMTADSSISDSLGGTAEPANADDVGSGTVDLTKAAKAGLVMDESFANYLAANPDTGGDPKTLNIPSARNSACGASCNWSRTVKDTLGVEAHWVVTTATDGTFNLSVQPTSFIMNEAPPVPNPDVIFKNGFDDPAVIIPITNQTLTITATGVPSTTGNMSFGEVILTEVNGLSPSLRITVAVNQNLP